MRLYSPSTKAFILYLSILCSLWSVASPVAQAEGPSQVKWLSWSDGIFKTAESQQKLILLNLEAVWCHWCHVMERETYSRADVAAYIGAKFLPVKVDQDSRPDLSTRYSDYGWPATIVLNAKGEDLQKLSGFQEPAEFLKVLRASVENPVPVAEAVRLIYPPDSLLGEKVKSQLVARQYSSFDRKLGGLTLAQKYLEADSVEYALTQAQKGKAEDRSMAELTLKQNQKLIDPVWGGVYQYSTGGDWNYPHFEKIMPTQANNLRLYSLAHAILGEQSFLESARSIYRYFRAFLISPKGAFFTSQDADLLKGQHSAEYFKADDQTRRSQGVPRVDTHIYSRENGMAIYALTSLYEVTLDQEVLGTALKAAEWIVRERKNIEGGFEHDRVEPGAAGSGPFLGDSLMMGRGMLALYMVTAEKRWLEMSVSAGEYIQKYFIESTDKEPGAYSAVRKPEVPLQPVRQIDENIWTARFLNLLYHYSGKSEFKDGAKSVMRYLVSPDVALSRKVESGILLADAEMSSDPLHVTIVGKREDPATQKLFKAALSYPSIYKRVEIWDRREGPLMNSDVTYPELPKSAAFVCSNRRCSLPIFDPAGVAEMIRKFTRED